MTVIDDTTKTAKICNVLFMTTVPAAFLQLANLFVAGFLQDVDFANFDYFSLCIHRNGQTSNLA